MFLYQFQRARSFIGGKWGHVTGLLFGKKWVRLGKESLMWDENWDIPQNYIRFHQYLFRIDENGMLLRLNIGDPTETWEALTRVD